MLAKMHGKLVLPVFQGLTNMKATKGGHQRSIKFSLTVLDLLSQTRFPKVHRLRERRNGERISACVQGIRSIPKKILTIVTAPIIST